MSVEVNETNINEREKITNSFLNDFYKFNHPRKEILFENLKEIYALISYLNKNMEALELEDIDFREGTEANLEEKIHLIEGFYKSIGVPLNFNDIIKDGTFEIIRTNPLDDILESELTRGTNKYYGENKSIEVYNNGLLTELLAFTESFIYVDYLENQGYKKEAITFKISEYKHLYRIVKAAYLSLRIYLLYFLLGEVSKENYKYLYKEDETYENALNIFENLKKQDQDAIFIIIWYSIGAVSMYNYERYKEDNNYIEKIKELNDRLQSNITLESALKIMDITLDGESLTKILEGINNFKNRLVEEQSNYIKNSSYFFCQIIVKHKIYTSKTAVLMIQ